MAQIAKVIDVTRSFAPVDPNAFPENMMYTQTEDSPEKEPPILAFEGYNFLPTSYGYKSYFGLNSTLDIAAFGSKCDTVLLYQFGNYKNVLVALAEDGIHISRPTTTGAAWVHSVVLATGGVGVYLQWTYAIIENKLYMYRQGESLVYLLTPTSIDLVTEAVTVSSIAPTVLNMAGQMGIFRANGRLGFWDSANSISWSSLNDFTDYEPRAETLAGYSTFNGVVGRIVTIIPQGDGFVIYATKSIVGVRWSSVANILWDSSSITDAAGISYPFQVAKGLTEMEHFAFTSTGIKRIGNYNALNKSHAIEDIVPDVYDYLKESRTPVRLDMINGRYLIFSLTDNSYIDGKTTFTYNTIDSVLVRILYNDGAWDGIATLPEYISGVSVSTDIAAQIGAGATTGMYNQWNATGKRMYLSRNPSAIYPYNIDSFSQHVPNSPLDATATLDSYATAADVVALPECVPDDSNTNSYQIGWSVNNLGGVDSYLTEFFTTQETEWLAFQTIQQANIQALQALPGGSTSASPIGQIYESVASAYTALAAAQAGATPTNTLIASVLDGTHAVVGPVVAGPTTFHATATLEATFTGGYDVSRVSTPVFGIVQVAASGSLYAVDFVATSINMANHFMGSYAAFAPYYDEYDRQTNGGTMYSTVSYDDAVQTLVNRLPFGPVTPTAGIFYNNPHLGHDPVTGIPTVHWDYYYNGVLQSTTSSGPTGTNLRIATTEYAAKTTRPNIECVYPDESSWADVGFNPPVGGFYGACFSNSDATQAAFLVLHKAPAVIPATTPAGAYWTNRYISGSSILYYKYDSLGNLIKNATLVYGITVVNYPRVAYQLTEAADVVLDIVANPNLSLVSTATAWQETLEWAYIPYGTPGGRFTTAYGAISVQGTGLPGITMGPIDYNVTYPGNTHLLQDGAVHPYYPDYVGALVLDIGLKKWGKLKASYTALLDYNPVNSIQATISYTHFGMDMACLDSAGVIKVFDARPVDSWMRYGKVGYYRLGMTQMHEVLMHFRNSSTGSVELNTSLDGRALELSLSQVEYFNIAASHTMYAENVGRWHTIKISGQYDLQFLEIRGTVAGRR